MVRFVSKMIKWLTPSKEGHGEKKVFTCCFISPVVMKSVPKKNENRTTIKKKRLIILDFFQF